MNEYGNDEAKCKSINRSTPEFWHLVSLNEVPSYYLWKRVVHNWEPKGLFSMESYYYQICSMWFSLKNVNFYVIMQNCYNISRITYTFFQRKGSRPWRRARLEYILNRFSIQRSRSTSEIFDHGILQKWFIRRVCIPNMDFLYLKTVFLISPNLIFNYSLIIKKKKKKKKKEEERNTNFTKFLLCRDMCCVFSVCMTVLT